jgi:trk system potassium uptake protein TrkA
VKIIIVGCGRVGAALADTYDRAGHDVTVLDISTRSFERLSSGFHGSAIRGDGTDEDVLRRAGAEGADVFLALTEGDNRNVMAAQLANEALGVKRVIAKINDPVRATAYAELGIATLCRTGLMMDAVDGYIGLPKAGLPGMLAPTGHHGGVHGDHHNLPASGGGATPSASGGGAGEAVASGQAVPAGQPLGGGQPGPQTSSPSGPTATQEV